MEREGVSLLSGAPVGGLVFTQEAGKGSRVTGRPCRGIRDAEVSGMQTVGAPLRRVLRAELSGMQRYQGCRGIRAAEISGNAGLQKPPAVVNQRPGLAGLRQMATQPLTAVL